MQRNGSNLRECTLLFDVWLVTHLTSRLLDDHLRPLGLTGDEFGLYSLIHSVEPIAPGQVSRLTGMAQTTVSGMVRRLAARGHLVQVPNPQDARSRLLRLSDDGRHVTEEAAGVLVTILPRLHGALASGPDAVRTALADLDSALRGLTDVAPRPYAAPAVENDDGPPHVTYGGPRLSEAQEAEVRMFIDWLRTRDRKPPQLTSDDLR
ncbi:DNA-binding transcriptional regulator, MarR family [Pseudonocardia thermophila]|uniref:DNA-binding transcriptional regulator, MarR family n=1 Tax=Pseudonocardia thermophila TaxID=1848 RepID=A0A1M6ZQZ4_PSETH|nr:MarR family transcriptional regulator [Pseudonocardia thermophila]SHL32882.1 DNA-binding transcriptional regulator, MarR family [Pseudonocardia thermophila]